MDAFRLSLSVPWFIYVSFIYFFFSFWYIPSTAALPAHALNTHNLYARALNA